jgi:hypothetical protein
MLASWETPWLCKGRMIKRLLVTFMPKHNANGINWQLLQNSVHHYKKPTLVNKLVSEQLLQVLGLNAWSMGNMFQDATSQMEKDEDLQEMIRSTHFVYAQQLKMAWDVKNWD